ncbi:hypothetical protein D7M11_31165 [Paenibacillus ginsengarvi]|uniref:Uncharacterized protein n=1 Tax=Paenibacillus ginsengarvi TaxID=400777 RepID=A0A3B0BDA9_9BACL|nr:hypothetical protein D7M11_31165 [Paenibacillus ginsengarvi]
MLIEYVWKRVFELAKAIYTIPDNDSIAESPKNQFMKNKTLGMLLDLNILNQLVEAEKDGLHWDVAQYPSYPSVAGCHRSPVMRSRRRSVHPVQD